MNRYEAIVAIVRSIPSERRTLAATTALVLIAFPAVSVVAIIAAVVR